MTDQIIFPASIVDESAYLLEKSAKYPLTFHIILTIDGEVKSKIIREALTASLALHPKLQCILTKNYPSTKSWFRYCWKYLNIDSRDILTETEDTEPEYGSREVLSYFMKNHFSPYLDISRHPPLRVKIIKQKGRIIMVFLFHHAAVDGLSGLMFVQSFVQNYEKIFYHQNEGGYRSPDFKSISRPEINSPFCGFSLPNFYNNLKYASEFMLQPPTPIITEGDKKSDGDAIAVCREIPPDQYIKIRADAKKYRTTLNHYLLSTAFLTIKKWNQEAANRAGRIYVNVSVNLRSPKESHILGNLLSGVNISLKTDSINHRKEILSMLRKKWIFLKDNMIAQKTIDFSWFLRPIPLGIKKIISNINLMRPFSPSIALPNLGVYSPNPTHRDENGYHCLGPACITKVIPLTLILPWPQIALLIYNERMIFNLTAFRSHVSQKEADKLLDCFIRQLTD